MDAIQHEYAGEADQREMLELVRACPAGNLHGVDLPYRFSSWAFDDPGNVTLWRAANGTLLAWAVLQTPFWTIDCACHPDAEASLYPQLLAWADLRAGAACDTPAGHPMWFANVFTNQAGRIHALEQAGFTSQADVGEGSWSKVLMMRPAQEAPAFRIPPGFTVRSLAGESEVAAYVELHRAVFESKNMTVEWRARTLQRPEYVPDLDVVVAAPDNRLAAFCVCWLSDPVHSPRIGHVEPLGCGQPFRQYALGRVALAEGLRRLQSHGAEQIYVETDNYRNTAFALYQSLGFRVVEDVLVFRKDYATV